MRGTGHPFQALALVIGLVGGCATTPAPTAEPTPPIVLALPAVTAPPNFGGCAGVGLDVRFFLAGDPTRRPAVYARVANGRFATITWPQGYVARFAPSLEIVRGDGLVVAHDGDEITDGDLHWPGLFACLAPDSIAIFQVADLRH